MQVRVRSSQVKMLATCVARFWVTATLGLAVGCGRVGRLDEKERNSHLVARAYELLDAGQHNEAAVRFQEALDLYPLMARPHLDLAMILHERRQDFVRAIYHYRRYLELRPDTEKTAMIEGRIQKASVSFAQQVRSELGERSGSVSEDDPGEGGGNAASLDSLRADRELLLAERTRQREELARQQEVLTQAQVAVNRLEAALLAERNLAQQLRDELEQTRRAQREERVLAPVREPQEVAVPRTYTVRPNDSLSVIAHKVYGDATQWRKIQEANREVLGDSVALRIGQVLVIP